MSHEWAIAKDEERAAAIAPDARCGRCGGTGNWQCGTCDGSGRVKLGVEGLFRLVGAEQLDGTASRHGEFDHYFVTTGTPVFVFVPKEEQ